MLDTARIAEYGIGERAAHGIAASPDAVETSRKAGPLDIIGWECAQRHDATVRG